MPYALLPSLYCTVAYFLGQRWVRFGIVGVLSTLIYFVPAVLCERAGLPVFLGNTIAYVCGFVVSYTGHRVWTFHSKASHGSALPKFMTVQVFAFGLNTATIWVFMHLGFSYVFAMTVAIICIPILTFIISKIWVFRDPAAYIPKVPRAPASTPPIGPPITPAVDRSATQEKEVK